MHIKPFPNEALTIFARILLNNFSDAFSPPEHAAGSCQTQIDACIPEYLFANQPCGHKRQQYLEDLGEQLDCHKLSQSVHLIQI